MSKSSENAVFENIIFVFNLPQQGIVGFLFVILLTCIRNSRKLIAIIANDLYNSKFNVQLDIRCI